MAVRFEWSPLRSTQGKFLGNRSAFDVAFDWTWEMAPSVSSASKRSTMRYCRREAPPHVQKRLPRDIEVANDSRAFGPVTTEAILGTQLQQIWLDHLLVLSMLQHAPRTWTWAKFILVHPKGTQATRGLRRNTASCSATLRHSKLSPSSHCWELVCFQLC